MRTDGRKDGQTDKHGETNIRVRNFADANKTDLLVIWKVSYHKFVSIIM